ncbi:hypothetical protein C8R48DRAFT_701579 [Suillus tomentosus]|nr:hypothetical protein C8R48DRAFT_701579 [Suillus tomentosus]
MVVGQHHDIIEELWRMRSKRLRRYEVCCCLQVLQTVLGPSFVRVLRTLAYYQYIPLSLARLLFDACLFAFPCVPTTAAWLVTVYNVLAYWSLPHVRACRMAVNVAGRSRMCVRTQDLDDLLCIGAGELSSCMLRNHSDDNQTI